MKRRSQPKQKKTRGTYGKKLASSGSMTYGPTKHRPNKKEDRS